jgi:hypothetical protein
LDFEDIGLRFLLYDYANNPIEEGDCKITIKKNATSIQVLVPPLMSSLALRADFRFYR